MPFAGFDVTINCRYNLIMQEFDWDENNRLLNARNHAIDKSLIDWDRIDAMQDEDIDLPDDRACGC